MAKGKFVNKKIAIMGGTFDPIHLGHIQVAEKARDGFSLDKVLFIPAGLPPHKGKTFAPFHHRMEMTRIAVKGKRCFSASSIEENCEKPSYTYDTVALVGKEYPGARIFLIMGEDSFYELETWHRYKELGGKVFFLVAPRAGTLMRKVPQVPFLKYGFIDMPPIEISSSCIRNCLFSGKNVKYAVPEKVLEYIRRHKLYGR